MPLLSRFWLVPLGNSNLANWGCMSWLWMTGCTAEPSNNSTSDGVDVVSNVFFGAEVGPCFRDKSSADDVDSSFVDVVVISINAFLSNEDFVVAAAAAVVVSINSVAVLDDSFLVFSPAFVVILVVGVIFLGSNCVVSNVVSGLTVVSVLRRAGDVCL